MFAGMTDSNYRDHVAPAGPTDVPDLVALSRETLPTMSGLHTEEKWRSHNRFGVADTLRGSSTFVLRDGGPEGPVVAFVWVDAALFIDYRVEEPWWCVNALAVAPAYRRAGRARRLVSIVEEAAARVSVSALYGQSVPDAVPFWQGLGWEVGTPGETLRSSRPVAIAGGDSASLRLSPGDGDRWILRDLLGGVSGLALDADLTGSG